MSDLGDLLGVAPSPRLQVPCRNPRCRRPVYVDRAVYGYGEDCAESIGLIVRRSRADGTEQTGPDLLAELDALAADE